MLQPYLTCTTGMHVTPVVRWFVVWPTRRVTKTIDSRPGHHRCTSVAINGRWMGCLMPNITINDKTTKLLQPPLRIQLHSTLSTPSFLPSFLPRGASAAAEAMGICCSKGKEELEEEGFPWKHDAFFHDQLWSAGVSMHTKQGWKGANQDAMTTCQVTTSLLHWIACSSLAASLFPCLFQSSFASCLYRFSHFDIIVSCTTQAESLAMEEWGNASLERGYVCLLQLQFRA